MKKKFPDFKTDDEAEAFVETADLSEYDFTGLVPMRFELKRKDTSISLRLPEELLEAVRIQAKRVGIPYQRFMRWFLYFCNVRFMDFTFLYLRLSMRLHFP
jgi:predicted DNA binding CopG/RHH family protein